MRTGRRGKTCQKKWNFQTIPKPLIPVELQSEGKKSAEMARVLARYLHELETQYGVIVSMVKCTTGVAARYRAVVRV